MNVCVCGGGVCVCLSIDGGVWLCVFVLVVCEFHCLLVRGM